MMSERLHIFDPLNDVVPLVVGVRTAGSTDIATILYDFVPLFVFYLSYQFSICLQTLRTNTTLLRLEASHFIVRPFV